MEPCNLNDKLPSELRVAVMKQAALNGWGGSNAVCSLDILAISTNRPPYDLTYHMIDNAFLNILNRNGIHKISTEGRKGAQDALREARPHYVLLYTADTYFCWHSKRPMPPSIPRSVIPLPETHSPSEAFVDILSEKFVGAWEFLDVIAGVFGRRVRHVYLMNPHHRFTTTGMEHCSDTSTKRDYAFRSAGFLGLDPTSLANGATSLFRWADGPYKYSRWRDTRQETLAQGFLTQRNSRVVISQATGDEFAEVWRQGREGGERRIAAFASQTVPTPMMHLEIWRLRDIIIDILLTSQESGSVLPDLESISLMTVSRPTEVRTEVA